MIGSSQRNPFVKFPYNSVWLKSVPAITVYTDTIHCDTCIKCTALVAALTLLLEPKMPLCIYLDSSLDSKKERMEC